MSTSVVLNVVPPTEAPAPRRRHRDYVLRHAVEAAEADLAERRVFVVDDEAWDELQRMLSAPSGLPAAMAELLAAPSALEQPPG